MTSIGGTCVCAVLRPQGTSYDPCGTMWIHVAELLRSSFLLLVLQKSPERFRKNGLGMIWHSLGAITLYPTLYASIRPYPLKSDSIRLHRALSGSVRLHATLSDSIRFYPALSGSIRLCPAPSDSVRLCSTLSDSLDPTLSDSSPTLSDSVRLYPTLCTASSNKTKTPRSL